MVELDWILEKYYSGEYKQKLTSYKRFCELGIILFFVFLYLFFKNYRMPLLRYQFTQAYRQIDWQKYVPERKIKPTAKHKIPLPSGRYTGSDQSVLLDVSEMTADVDLLKNNVSSIINQAPARSLVSTPDWRSAHELTYQLPQENSVPSIFIEPQQDFLKEGATDFKPRNLVVPKNVGSTIAINDAVVNDTNLGNQHNYSHRNKTGITSDKIIPDAGVVEIPIISREKITTKPEISVIVDQLMLWMKKHPVEFNQVVKSFMMYESGDLTSKVVFRSKNRVFELYLLYKAKIREIRICLIEGDQSTMLIDSGFKKQSNYLRTGNVTRQSDNSLFSFSTTQYPATERKTSEFYQFFLSWWEQAK